MISGKISGKKTFENKKYKDQSNLTNKENNLISKNDLKDSGMNLDYYNLDSSLEEVFNYVSYYKNFSFDFEVVSLSDLTPLFISFVVIDYKNNKRFGFVVDLRFNLNLEVLFKIFDITNLVICHNLSFDLRILYFLGYDIYSLKYKIYDTMIALYVLDTAQPKTLKNYIVNSTKYEGVSDLLSFDLTNFKVYNLKDSYFTYKLYFSTYKQLYERRGAILGFFLEIQIAILSVYMVSYGVHIDFSKFRSFEDDILQEINSLTIKLKKAAKEIFDFDLDLKKRLSLIDFFENRIFKDFGLDKKEYMSEKNNISLTIDNISDIIEKLDLTEEQKNMFNDYISLKELKKLYENYSQRKLRVNYYKGRIIPNINTTGTRTVRMTITNPPFQTIPSSGYGKKIRSLFCGQEENKLLVLDLSQLELRILVHYLNEDKLIKSYNNGSDLHSTTSNYLGLERKDAKIVNFMIIYGGGTQSLSKKLKIDVEKAKDVIKRFTENFTKYESLKNFVINFSESNKFLKFPLGYRRYFDEDGSGFSRSAFNSLIQTTASIYVKFGMYLIFNVLFENTGLLLQVHDELIFENKEKYLDIYLDFVRHFFENTFVYYDNNFENPILGQKLKFKVEGKIGNNWLEAKN